MARRISRQAASKPAARPADVRAILIAILLLGSLGYYAYKYWTRVPPVPLTGAATAADGDSIEIAGTRIRLEGIDAPELEQTCADTQGQTWACGRAALRAVRAHIAGPRSAVRAERARSVQARACRVLLPDGSDLNAWIVQQGWALAYGHSQVYRPEQDEAQAAKRGIWAGTFTPPREWRQQHPR